MQVPFVSDSYRGQVPINYYPAKDDDKGVIVFGRPGLTSYHDIGSAVEVRALRAFNNYLYFLAGNTAYRLNTLGILTTLGTVSNSTGAAWIETNGVQVLFVDGSTGYVYTISTGVWAHITDADFPGSSAATYQDGYGIVLCPGTAQFWLSNLYDFTAWDATDYATAEGWPDNLVTVLSDHRDLFLFGDETVEIWYNAGTSPFPFTRREGAYIETGCGAAASPARLDNMIYFLSDKAQVMRIGGYQVQVASNRKVERAIMGYSVWSDAQALSLTFEGHPFYVLNFPTANVTWVYDVASQVWGKWASYPNQGRFRGNCYAYFNGKHLMGDYSNGLIYEFDSATYQDNGEHLISELQSKEISQEGQRIFFPSLQIEFVPGLAPVGIDAQAMLSWSDDGGNTWSSEHWQAIGEASEYSRRSIWRRMGSALRRQFKLKVSAAINRNILSVGWLK
jgi:hypothetical protein